MAYRLPISPAPVQTNRLLSQSQTVIGHVLGGASCEDPPTPLRCSGRTSGLRCRSQSPPQPAAVPGGERDKAGSGGWREPDEGAGPRLGCRPGLSASILKSFSPKFNSSCAEYSRRSRTASRQLFPAAPPLPDRRLRSNEAGTTGPPGAQLTSPTVDRAAPDGDFQRGAMESGQRAEAGRGRASPRGLPGLLVLLGCCWFCWAEEEVLMNTKLETSDLRWTNHPADDQQWEELSGLDEDANSVRTFQICTPSSPASYWLRTRWIPRRAATTLYVEIRWVEPPSGLRRQEVV
ncbi:hypothetical protein CCH79_00019730 [Gambusia affinis]|uniref:Eph LBD domain-containing protein n=1 Tax=Gambusia affinis TaxID=33528 RepID=A0A315V726_GAMAF|nr:hypothetical protein CCH79_00019730 [Gambusia affinis]